MRATKRQHALILFKGILRKDLEHLGDQRAQVSCAATVTPFVVVPRNDLGELAFVAEHLRKSAAKIELCGSSMMSELTIGSSV